MSTTATDDDTNNQGIVTISEWIANAIADTGCRVVYGGHGGALVPLVNAVVQHPLLTWVYARNEHNAATMAAAHAKYTGTLGVVIATSGPGATNLLTGLMEVLDQIPLLAITGLKPLAQLGYSEFQDVNQSHIFATASGIRWSKDTSSVDATIPLLRDAVSVALTHRTCAHLAIPVDVQAATSPIKLKHFCASHANIRLVPPSIHNDDITSAAKHLLGIRYDDNGNLIAKRLPRNVIALGLRCTDYGHHNNILSKVILELAEVLNTPVVTRLDTKGMIDEIHPLAFGVIGIHGKPGLEMSATLISTADCILSIGVPDDTLLICNSAGLQVREFIEIAPDALAVVTRYNAEYTLIGNFIDICQALTKRIQELLIEYPNHRQQLLEIDNDDDTNEKNDSNENDGNGSGASSLLDLNYHLQYMVNPSIHDVFNYAAHDNRKALMIPSTSSTGSKKFTFPELDKMSTEEVQLGVSKLWNIMHRGNWRKLLEVRHNAEHGGWKRFECNTNIDDDNNGTPLCGTTYCHPSDVMYAISEIRLDPKTKAISRNATICIDVGDVTLWSSLCLHLHAGSRTLYSERLGTMGYALNAGIAAILAQPSGPACSVVLVGDGGFQMSLQELATFQQMKRNGDLLLCIVFDNETLGRVEFGFDNALGCDICNPNYVTLAQAYGGNGIRLDRSANAYQVIYDAMNHQEGLYIIHVIVDRHVKADMATFHDNALKIMNSG